MPIKEKIPSFEENVKNSFVRVKEHVSILEKELRADRDFIIKQNNQIRFLLEEINHISTEKDKLKAKLVGNLNESSIGNDGVYSNIHSFIHSDIHSLNIHSTDAQSNRRQSNQKEETKEKIQDQPEGFESFEALQSSFVEDPGQLQVENVNENKEQYANKRLELPLKQVLRRQQQIKSKGILDGQTSIIELKSELFSKFSSLSKQEFLTFLTVYQLEEEVEHVSYIDISAKLNLSEGCIRTYVSSLIKKGIPLFKTKYNNKVVYLSIIKDFRALNFKRELMALYYKSDPSQKTLS